MMIGAKDLPSPAQPHVLVHLRSRGLFTLWAGGTRCIRWTFYTPYSSTYSNSYVIMTALGIFITGFSSILTGLNFIVTIHTMRAPGLTWFRLPLFVWSHYATSLIMVLGTPVVAVTILMVAVERIFHLGIFDPKLGGDPILFQHLFWFYSHPAFTSWSCPRWRLRLVTTFSPKIFGSVLRFASMPSRCSASRVGPQFVSGSPSTLDDLLDPLVPRRIPRPQVFNLTATIQGLDLVRRRSRFRSSALHDWRPDGSSAAIGLDVQCTTLLHRRALPYIMWRTLMGPWLDPLLFPKSPGALSGGMAAFRTLISSASPDVLSHSSRISVPSFSA